MHEVLPKEADKDLDIGLNVEGKELGVTDDCTEIFTTDRIFQTRKDLVDWARTVGKENGVVVVIRKSDYGSLKRKELLTLGCERGGKYVPYKGKLTKKSSGTRKCECPFKLRGRPRKSDGCWRLNVLCGLHNHARPQSLVGHAFVGRFTSDEKLVFRDMVENRVKPGQMLVALKEKNPTNLTTIDQIYNASKRYKRTKRNPFTEMQHLMHLLDRDKYVYWHQKDVDSDVVQDVFWAHPRAIELFNLFPNVVLVDSTYKTNRYGFPLLEMVGVTSTNITFSIGFAYMSTEKTHDVVWALSKLKGLIANEENLPNVIVTDKDLALMAAVVEVFPKANHLLCRFHISKNVIAKCKLYCDKKYWDVIREAWCDVMDSVSEDEYAIHLKELEILCKAFDQFKGYIHKTWLDDHRHKFVKCWIDEVMHFGNTTTNRVEGAHASLKLILKDSKGDLASCWTAMNKQTILQHTKIMSSFEHSIFIRDHKFKDRFYKNLHGFVSKIGLELIAKEKSRVGRVGANSSECRCTLRRTHGLPCACELARYSCVPLASVNHFWRRLSWANVDASKDPSSDMDLKAEIEAICYRFKKADLFGKRAIKEKMREIAFPDTTSMRPPPVKVKTKGRTKGEAKGSTKRNPSYFEIVDEYMNSLHGSNTTIPSVNAKTPVLHPSPPVPKWKDHKTTVVPKAPPKRGRPKKKKDLPFLEKMPLKFHSHITAIIDVVADGHCGFRAISALLGKGEHLWMEIREKMIHELMERSGTYSAMYGSDLMQQILCALTVVPGEIITKSKWLTLPDMGYIVATAFNVVLISLGNSGCTTYLPLTGPVPQQKHIIVLGHVNGNHWVQVKLKKGHPMPMTAPQWRYHRDVDAAAWEFPFLDQMTTFQKVLEDEHKSKDNHIVDLTVDG